MNSALNNPTNYLKHLISTLSVDVHETPMTHAQYTRDISQLQGTATDFAAKKIVGKDFHGILVDTPHGRVAFMAVHVPVQGWMLSIASTSAADEAYDLADYRWNEKHIHEFFSKHLGVRLPKGTFIAHGEMVSFTQPTMEFQHAVS